MSKLSEIFEYEKNKLKNLGDAWKEDPERALLGINTPLDSKVWGKVTGKDYKPTVDMFGGDTKFDQQSAQERGIDPTWGHRMHNIARAITTLYAGSYGAEQLGGLSMAGETGAEEEAAGGGGAASAWKHYLPPGGMSRPRQPETYQNPQQYAPPNMSMYAQNAQSALDDEEAQAQQYWGQRQDELRQLATHVVMGFPWSA